MKVRFSPTPTSNTPQSKHNTAKKSKEDGKRKRGEDTNDVWCVRVVRGFRVLGWVVVRGQQPKEERQVLVKCELVGTKREERKGGRMEWRAEGVGRDWMDSRERMGERIKR